MKNFLIECSECSENVRRRDMKAHLESECEFRTVSCPHSDCGEEMAAHALENHLKYECCSMAIKKRFLLFFLCAMI